MFLKEKQNKIKKKANPLPLPWASGPPRTNLAYKATPTLALTTPTPPPLATDTPHSSPANISSPSSLPIWIGIERRPPTRLAVPITNPAARRPIPLA